MGKRGKSHAAKGKKINTKSVEQEDNVENYNKTRIVDGQLNDSEDEEIDDEAAFNSEDEKMYGALFASKKAATEILSDEEEDESLQEIKDSDDDASDSDSEDEEDDNDGGQFMLEMLEKLDAKPETDSKPNLLAAESEFSAAVLHGAKLSMEQLMQGIQDESKSYKILQKDMAQLTGLNSSKLQTTQTPAAKVISERAKRQVHYDETRKDVSQWTHAVQQLRNAESLDFRCKEVAQLTSAGLVSDFTPQSKFEREISKALEEAGAVSEQQIISHEDRAAFDDDLGLKSLTMEEFQARRAQLAKMRALMFYEEQKAHRINKIKSKKYRKIRKKQLAKEQANSLEAQLAEDPDLAREMQEKEELERMKERMTLAHKNTSKWAKHQIERRRKGNLDEDAKQALAAQLRTGEELRRKTKALRNGNASDDDEDDEHLVNQARALLTETLEPPEEKSGLLSMRFMQRGIEIQRNRAKEEARKLLEELEANMEDEAVSEVDEEDDEKILVKSSPINKESISTTNPTNAEDLLKDGKLVATNLQFGKSNVVTVSGGIDINDGSGANADAPKGHTHTIEVSASIVETPNLVTSDDEMKSGQPHNRRGKRQNAATEETTNTSSSNPWMTVTTKKPKKGDTRAEAMDVTEAANAILKDTKKKVAINKTETATKTFGSVEKIETSTSIVDPTKSTKNTATIDKEATQDTSVLDLSQEDLVRRAFAAPTDAELEEELEQERVSFYTVCSFKSLLHSSIRI